MGRTVLGSEEAELSLKRRRASFSDVERTRELYHDPSIINLALLVNAGNNAGYLNLDFSNKNRRKKNHSRSHYSQNHITHLFKRYYDKQLLCVNGTARNKALPNRTRQFLNDLAIKLESNGVGLICGGAETGAMGAAIEAFKVAIDASTSNHNVEIASVLLRLIGKHGGYEPPFSLDGYGFSSKKQSSWLNRTPALHGIGRQDAMLFVEGGLGSFFEVFYPLACRQLKDKGIVGAYDAIRPPSELYFVSDTTIDGKNFWKPTDDLLTEMLLCGLSKPEYTEIELLDSSHFDFAVECIAHSFETAAKRRGDISKKSISPKQAKYEQEFLIRLSNTHLALQNVEPHPSNPFRTLLDNLVAGHRTYDHFRKVTELYSAGRSDEAHNYADTVALSSEYERNIFRSTLDRLSKKPAIYLLGSSKENWNEELENYYQELISQAVFKGLTIVIDGSGQEGMPLKWSKMWAQAKQDCKSSNSELVRVQLTYNNEEQPERKFTPTIRETLLPSVLNIETKTALAASIGSKRAVIMAPGGIPEMLAFSQIILDSQLAGSVDGAYASTEDRPNIHVINVPMREGGRKFFDPLKEQLATMELAETISPGDYNREWFTDLTIDNAKIEALRAVGELLTNL